MWGRALLPRGVHVGGVAGDFAGTCAWELCTSGSVWAPA